MANVGELLFKKYGLSAIVVAIVGALSIWGLAHWAAAPGSEVSVLFGLVRYTKAVALDRTDTGLPSSKSSDADAVKAIRREAPDLMKVSRSAAGGLWLTAEATASKLDTLLLTADQLKSEYRAEALADLTYSLTLFDRSEDAQRVAERSLAATYDVPMGRRVYSLVDVAEKFADAKLTAIARDAAEKALSEVEASGKTDGLTRLVHLLVRISSVNDGLTVARRINDPKVRSEALGTIVSSLIKSGQSNEAAQVIQEALAASIQIPKAIDRAYEISYRTREQARLGRYDEASKLARLAKEEALKINPEELFGQLTIDLVKSDMTLFERHPDEIIRLAEYQRRPGALVRLARSMPEGSDETSRVIRSAQLIGMEINDPLLLAEVSELLESLVSPKDGAVLAKKATEIALQSNNIQTREPTLLRTAEVLARSEDFEMAFATIEGINDVRRSAELAGKVLSRCYVKKARPGKKAQEILSRTYLAASNLEDRDRSEAYMHLAVGYALLGNYPEAYRIGQQVPLSGQRLAAYSTIVLRYELQRSPRLEEKVRAADGGEALLVVFEPIFSLFDLD
jgi:tetratricopeptide (TPR) repeat protein